MKTLKIQHLLVIICIAIFFIQCKDEKIYYKAPTFLQKYNAKVQIINNEYLFRYAHQPQIFDSMLIIGDMSANDNICIFNRNNGNLIKSFGKIGNGPEELTTPVTYSIDKTNGYLYINDYSRKNIVQYNLKEIKNGQNIKTSFIKLSEEVEDRNRIIFIKDSLFISDGFNDRLALITPNKIIKTSTNSPNIHNKFEFDKDWFAFTQLYTCMAASPNGKMFVSATIIGGVLEIYNIEKEDIKLYKTLYLYEPIFDKREHVFTPTQETIYGFCHLSANNNFFYATAHGKISPTTMPNTIWKFDWEGNPVASYTCEYCIENFTVDDNNDLIYATIYDENGEQVIGIIDIKNATLIQK